MPIRQTTPRAELENANDEDVKRLRQAVIDVLRYVGEQVVNRARNHEEKAHDFTDRTGNLRSSIGYIITVDGQITDKSDFRVVKTGQEGSNEGLSYAQRLAAEMPNGIALIVVAGMSYATYVAARGYDVLDGSQLLAEQLVKRMLKQLKF
ncbi:MAG: hypothetical protein II401_11045 [Bacteroidales bacterium]|nr:hypothetical protein [Bacteroidales bacterium]